MLRMKAFPQAGHCSRVQHAHGELVDGPLLPWGAALPSFLVEAGSIWAMKCWLLVPLRAASAFTFLL